MRQPVVIDFETQYSFRERKDPKDLKISVAGVYSYATDTVQVFEEKKIQSLFKILEGASVIVGYNSQAFDLPVLAPYYPGDITKLPSFDMLEDIKQILGRRLGLDDLVKATLSKKKTGHGLRAIELYREGNVLELTEYCRSDVLLTKELFEYGANQGEIFYLTAHGKSKISVAWKKYKDGYSASGEQVSLTLPF